MISRRQFVIGVLGVPLFGAMISLGQALRLEDRPRLLSIMGASSLMGYVKASLPQWERQHDFVRVALSPGGSYAGLKAVASGHIDLALSDIEPPPGYIAVPLRRFRLGRIAIVIVAYPGVGVKGLQRDQVRALFAGTIANWREVGGQNLSVIPVSRPLSSGARQVLSSRLMKGTEFSSQAIIQLSNGAVAKTVRGSPGAVGYVEAVMPLSQILVMDLGQYHYCPANPHSWPLYAEPSIYVREDAQPLAYNLAEYLSHGSQKSRFGIYSGPGEGGAVDENR